MSRKIGCKPLVALALAGAVVLSAAPASAQHRHHGGGYGGHGYYGGHHHRGPGTGAIVGGTLLGLGLLGGALALSQTVPPPVYAPAPVYVPPPAYAPPPGYYGYK
jgi:hypothetical protein